MLSAWAFRVEQMSSIKCRCNRPFETDSCTSIPGPSHCKRPCTFSRSGADVAGAHSRRGSFPARGSNRPVPRTLCRVDRKLGLHVQRYVGSDKYLAERYARARKTLLQDRRPGDRSVRLPFRQTPGADMERQGQRGPEAARVARLQPRHRHDGKAEACHVCQARHAKVRASSHVLIG